MTADTVTVFNRPRNFRLKETASNNNCFFLASSLLLDRICATAEVLY